MDLYCCEDLAPVYLVSNNEARWDTISTTSSMHRAEESCIRSCGREIEERTLLGDQDVDG
jgi:hypothetical protein